MTHSDFFDKDISLSTIQELLDQDTKLELSADSRQRISDSRDFLISKITENDAAIYGVNTGFGSLYDMIIPDDDLKVLQKNLVLSHACGFGDAVPHSIVRLMLLLKAKGLSRGNSGVKQETVELLIKMFNEEVLPIVYTQGSLGASGDLAPLAHLSLPLIGEGEVHFRGNVRKSSDVWKDLNWEKLNLGPKEGLALLNGTQFMSAYAAHILLEARKLIDWSHLIAGMSIDAYDGRLEPFHSGIQDLRPHSGQKRSAQMIREILKGSRIASQKKKHVQDPYSFRCIPQVLGASIDALTYCEGVIETEINSVTDNPIVFPETGEVISAGNFHGQPLALSLDFMAIALAEIGSISERRTYKLISGSRDLPPFLVKNAGLNSGFMIPHYTAASIVSQNKQLCSPASVDTIDSSNGQEDHVSMGANAATKALQVLNNLRRVLSIELLVSAQALDFRRPASSSGRVEELHSNLRKSVPFVENDVYLHPLMKSCEKFLSK